jgi:hypothetical protein
LSGNISQATHHDAELILKLYDLRREPVMREARAHFVAMPPTLDAFLAVVTNPASKENSFVRQVCGYWEMVAAFVVHGALNEALVFDTCSEMYYVYAKIQPFLAALREKSGAVDLFANVQKIAEGSEAGRQRLARLQARINAAYAAASKTASEPA